MKSWVRGLLILAGGMASAAPVVDYAAWAKANPDGAWTHLLVHVAIAYAVAKLLMAGARCAETA